MLGRADSHEVEDRCLAVFRPARVNEAGTREHPVTQKERIAVQHPREIDTFKKIFRERMDFLVGGEVALCG